MSVKKANLGGTLYNVITHEDYKAHPEIYDKYSAVEMPDGFVYPIRGKNDFRPGMYDIGPMVIFKPPVGSDRSNYSAMNIIDFSKSRNIAEVIEAQNKVQSEERAILTSVDNITTPEIKPGDMPEMIALKTAIADKHIDLDKYGYRFGPNYNNDKRLLNRPTISMGKFKSIAKNLDMKVTLTIEDASQDVPNPIGHPITVELTGTDVDDEE